MLTTGAIGCKTANTPQMNLQLYSYPEVLLPVPQKVILTRNDPKQPLEVSLTKADTSSLIKVLRTAVDTSLYYEKINDNDWDLYKKFSLELDYEKHVDRGFPLPPAVKSELKVEQLPLAKPGEAKVEFLPPALPQKSQGGH